MNRLSENLDFDNGAGLDLRQLGGDLSEYFQKTYADTAASAKEQVSHILSLFSWNQMNCLQKK
jgi:hypothetical protein